MTFNALVWTFFVKALHQKGGSLVATVTSAATNYAASVSYIVNGMTSGKSESLNRLANIISRHKRQSIWDHEIDNFFTSSVTNQFNFQIVLSKALLGSLIFGETSSLLWWFGTSLVIMGVVLMTTGQATEDNSKTK